MIYSDQKIEELIQLVENSQWLVYISDQDLLPNPLVALEACRELKLDVSEANLPDHIVNFLKLKKIKNNVDIWAQQVDEYEREQNLELSYADLSEACINIHPNIVTTDIHSADTTFVFSTEPYPIEIIMCLADLVLENEFIEFRRPKRKKKEKLRLYDKVYAENFFKRAERNKKRVQNSEKQ